MHTYLRNRPAWMQLLIFGGLTGGIMIVGLTIGLAIIARVTHMNLMDIASLKPVDYLNPELTGVLKGLLITQFFAVFLLPSLVFAYLADPDPLRFAGLKKPDRSSFIFLGILIIVCSSFMVEWLGILNEKFVYHFMNRGTQQWIEKGETDVNDTLQNILKMDSIPQLLQSILLIGVLAAVGEEIFFRGILQRLFIQIFKSPWPGIIFTAALFSAFHGQFMGFIPRMILGIILGALYWYSGSLIPAMLGHFIYNTIQLLLIYFKVTDINSKVVNSTSITIFAILSIIVVVLLLNYMKKHSQTSYSKLYDFPRDDVFPDQHPENS